MYGAKEHLLFDGMRQPHGAGDDAHLQFRVLLHGVDEQVRVDILSTVDPEVVFINHLPHELVAAFRSTLEETRSADLLLHVVDAASQVRDRRIADVEGVLKEIGADEVPRLEVFNKIDLLEGHPPTLERDAEGRPRRVWLSAEAGTGLDLLTQAIAELTRGAELHRRLTLGPSDGRLRAWAFANAQVLSDQAREDGGWDLEIVLPRQELDRLLHHEPGIAGRFGPPEEPVAQAAATADTADDPGEWSPYRGA